MQRKTVKAETSTDQTRTYFLPEYGVSVQAKSLAEALKKAKKEVGDGE